MLILVVATGMLAANNAHAYFDLGSLNAVVTALGNGVVLVLFSVLGVLRFFTSIKSATIGFFRKALGAIRKR
jgi:hypothetical protein